MVTHKRLRKSFVALCLLLTLPAFSQIQQVETDLKKAYEDEVTQRTRLEELERRAAREKADYERKLQEIQQQVEAKKIQTENYKVKSEELLGQLESLNVELFELRLKKSSAQAEIKANEEKYLKIQSDYEAAKKEHADHKTYLEKQEVELTTLREKLEKSMARYKIETERMRQELAVMETEISAADAKRAALESAEMQARVEWLTTKKEVNEKRDLREKYLAHAAESRKKRDQARSELEKAQAELEKMKVEVAELSKRTRANVARYEEQTLEANRKKTLADAERIRVETEADKLRHYVAQVRASRDNSRKDLEASQTALIQSRMALATVKRELTEVVAGDQKEEFDNQKIESRLRGLASAAEADEILEGGRLFVTTRPCPVYRRPASQSPEVAQVDSGRKLLGREAIGPWIKITSEGRSVYVDKSCGRFEE